MLGWIQVEIEKEIIDETNRKGVSTSFNQCTLINKFYSRLLISSIRLDKSKSKEA